MLIPICHINDKLRTFHSRVYHQKVPQDTVFPFVVTEVSNRSIEGELTVTVWGYEGEGGSTEKITSLVKEKLKDLVYVCCDKILRFKISREMPLTCEVNPQVRGQKLVFKQQAYMM